MEPINYLDGQVALVEQDLPNVGRGFLQHSRSYQHKLESDFDGPTGFNWVMEQWPSASAEASGQVTAFLPGNRKIHFTESVGTYTLRSGNGELMKLVTTASGLKLTEVTERGTNIYEFNALDATERPGVFRKFTDSTGTVTEVTSFLHTVVEEVQQTIVSGGDTTTYSIIYDYNLVGENANRMQSAMLRKQLNGGDWTNLRRVTYAYCGAASPDGSLGDLSTATIQVPLANAAWLDTAVTYYRYYKGSYDATTNPGRSHLLKFKLGPEGYRRLVKAGLTPTTATDEQLLQYGEFYFEYDEEARAVKEIASAGCGGCGGSGGTEGQTFVRTDNPLYPTTDPTGAALYNTWKTKAVRTLADGNTETAYVNKMGSIMLRVYEETSSGRQWLTYYKYSANGSVLQIAYPSAVTGFDDSKADLMDFSGGVSAYLKDNDGLIELFEYYTSTDAGLSTTVSGGVEGFVKFNKIKKGESGSEIKVKEHKYFKRSTTDFGTSYPVAATIAYPSATDQTITITTSYAYTWWAANSQNIKQIATTLPAVATSQNGSGSADTLYTVFDSKGYVAWEKDARGFITHSKHDPHSGRLVQRIDDVDTATLSNPDGWTTPSDGGKHLITDYAYDDLGRLIEVLGPVHDADVNGDAANGDATVRTATWYVYKENISLDPDETRVGRGYHDVGGDTDVLIDPVTVVLSDKSGNAEEVVRSVRTTGSGRLTGDDVFARTGWRNRVVNVYNDRGRLTASRVYHTIPAAGDGVEGAHYNQTRMAYDVRGRVVRVQTPGGTVVRQVYDGPDRLQSKWMGSNDAGATNSDPTGGGAANNNMAKVEEYEYDNGNDKADGNLTETTRYESGTATRVINSGFDWRNRPITTDGEVDLFVKTTYDNLNRTTRIERYDTSDSGNLIGRTDLSLDDRGRLFKSVVHAMDPSTGTLGNSLTTNLWYDATSNVVKSLGAGNHKTFTKTTYDGMGWVTRAAVGYDTDETAYGDVDDLSGDTVLQQTDLTWNDAGQVVQTTGYQRHHDNTTATGALTTSNSRVTYSATWFDGIGRSVASANYGTNGGAAFTRPDTVPVRSDTALVSSVVYDDTGRASRAYDPRLIQTRLEYDAANRVVKAIENYQDGDPTTGTPDQDRTSVFTYNADGQQKTATAINPQTGDQTTTYVYGTTSADGLASSLLLKAVVYPDSDDAINAGVLADGPDLTYDRIELKYNRLGQILERKDQNGTVHTYVFDKLGRLTQDRVTTLGTNVDGAVRRIERTYEVRGMLTQLTSYDAATGGSVVNEVELEYNDFAQLTREYQAHGGAVATATTPKVQYAYANGADNHTRSTSMTYPNSRVVTYDYGTAGAMNDILSRVASVKDGATVLSAYDYLGLGSVVRIDYQQPDIRLDLFGGTSGAYAGIDRFGRIIDQKWENYTSSTTVEQVQHGYDRNSNRIYRDNTLTAGLDEFYTHDGLNRLIGVNRGTLNGTQTAISTLAFTQDWGLDALGNWSSFKQDDNGDGTLDLDQARAHNKANEIGSIGQSPDPTGTLPGAANWSNPVHDRAGNMTSLPSPLSPTTALTATYDAWNRLVKLTDGVLTIAEYQYDARGRRIVKKTYASGVLSETRHFYYSAGWQIVEERVGTSSNPELQYVWGMRYVDELVCRDRDTDANGTLDERFYALQDSNFNVTALSNTSGAIVERYSYTPYGQRTVLDAGFGLDADGISDVKFEMGHQGLMHDAESGLIYNRNRMLHSQLGRFLQRDPLGYIDGGNLYGYIEGNPANRLDAAGLTPNQTDAVTLEEYISIIERFEANNPGATPARVLRAMWGVSPNYIYTGTFGWIDSHHFLNSANGTAIGLPRGLVTFIGDIVEGLQGFFGTLLPIVPGIGSSAGNCEDYPSNNAGAIFGSRLDPSTPLSQQVWNFLAAHRAMDPKLAPDYSTLPKSEEEHERAWRNALLRRRGPFTITGPGPTGTYFPWLFN